MTYYAALGVGLRTTAVCIVAAMLVTAPAQADWMSDYSAGKTAYANNDYSKAISFFTKVIKSGALSDSDLSQVYTDRGLMYRQNEQYVLAVGDFENAISLDPINARTYNLRCNVYKYYNQQYNRALSDCNKAIDLVPNNANFLGERAIVYKLMGRRAEAVADYQQALRFQLEEDLRKSRKSREAQYYRHALKELGAKP